MSTSAASARRERAVRVAVADGAPPRVDVRARRAPTSVPSRASRCRGAVRLREALVVEVPRELAGSPRRRRPRGTPGARRRARSRARPARAPRGRSGPRGTSALVELVGQAARRAPPARRRRAPRTRLARDLRARLRPGEARHDGDERRRDARVRARHPLRVPQDEDPPVLGVGDDDRLDGAQRGALLELRCAFGILSSILGEPSKHCHALEATIRRAPSSCRSTRERRRARPVRELRVHGGGRRRPRTPSPRSRPAATSGSRAGSRTDRGRARGGARTPCARAAAPARRPAGGCPVVAERRLPTARERRPVHDLRVASASAAGRSSATVARGRPGGARRDSLEVARRDRGPLGQGLRRATLGPGRSPSALNARPL